MNPSTSTSSCLTGSVFPPARQGEGGDTNKLKIPAQGARPYLKVPSKEQNVSSLQHKGRWHMPECTGHHTQAAGPVRPWLCLQAHRMGLRMNRPAAHAAWWLSFPRSTEITNSFSRWRMPASSIVLPTTGENPRTCMQWHCDLLEAASRRPTTTDL